MKQLRNRLVLLNQVSREVDRLFRLDLSPESDGPIPPPLEHMELLVDRQGYLRARWVPGGGEGWADPARLLAEVERLAKEPARTPLADDHVH